MLATAITATGNGGVTHTYGLRSIVDGKSIRGDATATVGTSKLLTISHGLRSPKDPESPKRHLVRLDWSSHNTDNELEVLSVYIVLEIPQSATFTATDIGNIGAELANIYFSNLTAITNDEP
jgi:hypothetical protein